MCAWTRKRCRRVNRKRSGAQVRDAIQAWRKAAGHALGGHRYRFMLVQALDMRGAQPEIDHPLIAIERRLHAPCSILAEHQVGPFEQVKEIGRESLRER